MGCVSQKRKDETSRIGKVYHDITSKYNRNFNANLIIDEKIYNLDQQHQDDYSKILPVYPYMAAGKLRISSEDMDRVIEKTSVAIALHRPSHWTDDNYHLIGVAQYLKGDYESAEATFKYLLKYYHPDRILTGQDKSSRSDDIKMTSREREKQKQISEKDRQDRIKTRKKEIKRRNKLASKSRKGKIRDRKEQIKDREQLAKQGRSKPKDNENELEGAVADSSLGGNVKSTESQENLARELISEKPEMPKIKGDPDNYFLKHRPVYQESQLWLARTLIERDRYGEAENILRSLERDPKLFDDISSQAYVVQAYGNLKREQYEAAAKSFELAVEKTKNRLEKARYQFILAQIQEELGLDDSAVSSYDRVIRLNPGYSMQFNAQLKQLNLQWKRNVLTDDQFSTQLKKWVRDEKNINYQDQLYYTMALVDLKNNNVDVAIQNLSQSIRQSQNNLVQKAESYYTIAKLYFESEDYVKAKYYFDSTLTVLPETDERYAETSSLAKNLVVIAKNIEIIELQDSLIMISQLPEKELKRLAAQIKRERELAELRNRSDRGVGSAQSTRLTSLPVVSRGTTQSTSVFFAYDDKSVKKGVRDFERKWGTIELQDNWRRSQRTSFDSFVIEGQADPVTIGPISETEIDEIFKGIPRTEAELSATHTKIEKALFQLGEAFRSELGHVEKSVIIFEELLQRYPSTEHALETYYFLYIGHMELNNSAAAERYKKLILEGHPDSEFAKYIRHPEILRDYVDTEQQIDQHYNQVYLSFSAGNFRRTQNEIKAASEIFGTAHHIQSKLALISAMCTGQMEGREAYVNALKEIIAKYPDTEEEQRSKEIIRLLGIRFTETSAGIQEINPDSYFALTDDDNLYFILVPVNPSVDLNKARIDISDYNRKYHHLDNLVISTIVLENTPNQQIPMFVIRKFDGRDRAMAYYDAVQSNIGGFMSNPENFQIFASTQKNYRKILQLKSVDLYRDFFIREYLSN